MGKRFLRGLIAVLFLAGPAGAAVSFRQFVDQQLAPLKNSKASYGVVIMLADSGQVVYEANGDLPLAPASNQKLVTTIAAMSLLGPEYQFTTTLGRLNNDLVVIGDGDPGFGDPNLCETRPVTDVFDQWAKTLVAAGITQVSGNLIFDDSIFDRQFIHPNWPPDQINRWYAAPVGGLNLNDNCLDLTVGYDADRKPRLTLSPNTEAFLVVPEWSIVKGAQSTIWPIWESPQKLKVKIRLGSRSSGPQNITVKDPTLYFAAVCRERLAAGGIGIKGSMGLQRVRKSDGTLPDKLTIIARHSTPLLSAVRRANTNSQNFFAECMFKRIGYQMARSNASFGAGTWTTGQLAVKEFLQDRMGASLDGVVIDDGCGLSKHNRVTARLIARLLHYAKNQTWGGDFRKTLAVAGKRDGTLKRRMRGTAAAGKVWAKTGTIKGVNTLSGYVLDQQDRPRIIFSMLFNFSGASGKGWQAKVAEDKIVIMLAQLLANRPSTTQETTDDQDETPESDDE